MAMKREHKISEWQSFFGKCLSEGVSFNQFQTGVKKLCASSHIDGSGLLEAWVKCHDGGFTVRPRLIKYLEVLINLHKISDVDALTFVERNIETIVLSQDRYLVTTGPTKGEWRQCAESVILDQLTLHVMQVRAMNATLLERVETLRTYKPLLSFVSLFTSLTNTLTVLTGPVVSIAIEIAKYVLAYINELHLTGVLTSHEGHPPKALRKGFGVALESFIGVLVGALVNAPPEYADLAENLRNTQRQAELFDSTEVDQANGHITNELDAITYQQNILDTPVVTTRAALYIYLNAMLTGRPICDDAALFTYLNSRYTGNVEGLVADLITASFDVLANAINRTESTESINVYRSFLINKVPVLLEQFSSMIFPPSSIENCISGALHRMDSSADPFATQTFDLLSSTGMISEARQEFLFACALFNLIPEASIETILGDVPMQSLPESGKYDKNTLVSQCTTNSNRVEELVKELEGFEGNSSIVAAAIIDIIQTLCAEKDSLNLKTVCTALIKRTQALDVLLLFAPAQNLLQSLCGFLDNWQDLEDQGEHHPVYEEFGYIFFLVLVMRQHFDFSLEEFVLVYPDSFIRKYLVNGCTPLDVSEMSDSHKQKLGAWVKGLYDSENLDNDVLAACTPKEFHLLVATLFDQTLKASQSGVLGIDTIKGGFEYLLDPFLLPSMITALGWATRVLWATRNPAPHLEHLLPLLTLLIKPSNISNEASLLHDAVLSVAAGPLERALAHVQKLHPRRQDIDPLLNKLKSRIQAPRAAITSHSELETWSATTSTQGPGGTGGFLAAIRNTINALVTWSATGSLQSAPPHYTHKQILMGIQMLGASQVLNGILADASKLIASGSSQEVVLDVVSAMICAPVNRKGRAGMTLRDALGIACEDAFALSKTDAAQAELIVRLQRRVETQSPIKVETQDQIVQSTMLVDPVQNVQASAIDADGVDIEGIMKDVGGDFDMDAGTDADVNALFDL